MFVYQSFLVFCEVSILDEPILPWVDCMLACPTTTVLLYLHYKKTEKSDKIVSRSRHAENHKPEPPSHMRPTDVPF